MTSLTSVIIFVTMAFAGVMDGEAQEATEPLFLDTTLLPVAELTIRNTARSSKVESNPSSSTHHANNISSATTDMSYDVLHDKNSSVVEATMASSRVIQPVVTELTPSPSLRGALIHSDTTLQTLSVTSQSPQSPNTTWDTALLPSFPTTGSRSVITPIPSSAPAEASSSFLETSEPSTISMPDLLQQSVAPTFNRITTPDTNGGVRDVSTSVAVDKSSDMQLNGSRIGVPNVIASMAIEKSSEMQLSESYKDAETTRIVSTLGSAVVGSQNTDLTTPSSWYTSETEIMSRRRDMLYDTQFHEAVTTSAAPEATSVETGWYKSDVVSTQQDPSHQDVFAYSKRLSFVLKKRCNDDDGMLLETFERLNGQLAKMLNHTIPVNENQSAFACERMFHLTVPVQNMTDSVITETVKNLTKNFTFGDGFRVEKIYLYQNDHAKKVLFSVDGTEQTANNFDEYALTERELIAYIVAGISLATLIFILLTCCCVRFLCKKQTTSLDLCDIPHLNLKLEDYKLTPIPRPTISFSEYGRELFNPSYSEHTPKLEDTILTQQHFASDAAAASPGARESMSFPREMRTFGGKKSCSRVQSLDARPNARSGNGWMSSSREKLSTDFERRNSGFDNVAFRKWF